MSKVIDNNTVLCVLDKSSILAPSLDNKQLNTISQLVDKQKRIVGYKWNPDAKRIIRRTEYDIKETTVLTTFGVLTPMIFIKWLTLFKRIGLSVAVGIPMGYFIGKYESRRTLTNLCDTSDQEIGKQIRNNILNKGDKSVAARYLIDRGFGGALYPPHPGNIDNVKITDDYERSGKAYTKVVHLEGDIDDLVYVLNHVTVKDMKSFGRPGHQIGVEGSIRPCLDHYKATIKVHSVQKRKTVTGKEKKEEKKFIEEEKKKEIDKEMEEIFVRNRDETIELLKHTDVEEEKKIKERILKSTIDEMTTQQIHEMKEIVTQRNKGIRVEKKIHKAKTIGDLEREEFEKQKKQFELEEVDVNHEGNENLDVDSHPSSVLYTHHATMMEQPIPPTGGSDASKDSKNERKDTDDYIYFEEDSDGLDDYDYIYEDIAGTPLPADRVYTPRAEDPEYYDDILQNVMDCPIPKKQKHQKSKEEKKTPEEPPKPAQAPSPVLSTPSHATFDNIEHYSGATSTRGFKE